MELPTIPQHFRQRIIEAREQQLVELDLSFGNLTYIPDEVLALTHLQKLNLSYNNIQEIPPQISRLVNLRNIDLIGNQELTNIDRELVQLPAATLLSLTWDVNNNIPPWFSQIPQLGLDLIDEKSARFTSIEAIPNAIINLKNLVFLRIKLKLFSKDWLPWLKTVGELELDLINNQLAILP